MGKYRKKSPHVIAERWWPVQENKLVEYHTSSKVGHIKGGGTIRPGDWLVKHPDGSLEAVTHRDFIDGYQLLGPEDL